MSAYDILKTRGVTRLCHFTRLQNLTHIMSSEKGLLASSSIRYDTKNVTDEKRYDNEGKSVCCTIQYPNSWFLQKAMRENTDKIFVDWVVLYIDLSILNCREAKFCPCNASKGKGAYINSNMGEIESIFSVSVPTFSYPRPPKMLASCPTDGQAEILIRDNIPREYISGIAAHNEEVAKRVKAMLKIYGVEQIEIYIAPDVFTKNWSAMIKNGCKPDETRCAWLEEE